jgi:hypothetical protein
VCILQNLLSLLLKTVLPSFCFIFREISRKMNVPWCEYWGFLDRHIDLDSPEGLKKLEEYLQRQKEQKDMRLLEQREQERLKRQDMSVCEMFQQLQLCDGQRAEDIDIEPKTEGQSSASKGLADNIQTWPPSLAKLKVSTDVGQVQDNLDAGNNGKQTDIINTKYADVDTLSDTSDASYHTAVDDADLEYSDASEWPGDDDDYLLFIYG